MMRLNAIAREVRREILQIRPSNTSKNQTKFGKVNSSSLMVMPKIIFKYIVISRLARVANEVKNQRHQFHRKEKFALLGPESAKSRQFESYTHKSKENGELMPLIISG
jgi:hypothetical protein